MLFINKCIFYYFNLEGLVEGKHKGSGKSQRQEGCDRNVSGKPSRMLSDGPPEVCCDHKMINSSDVKQLSNKNLTTAPDDNPSTNSCCDSEHNLHTTSKDSQMAVCNSHVCVKLCSLILAQLVKAHTEVVRR